MANFKRLFSPPQGSYFLFGPRGTGKSTWIKSNYPDCIYIDLLRTDVLRSYAAHPEKLIKMLEAQAYVKSVVIDEIQKVTELLSIVHSIIEQKQEIQFILTGSNSRKLKKTGVDLLAGRAIKRNMHPFIACELGDEFNLDKALKLGMVPVVWGAKDPYEVLETYVDLYIEQEVKQEGMVRNIGQFARFLSVIAFSHANLLNSSNIARECEVKRHTVDVYIDILKDLLLACEIPVFSKRSQRTLTSHPKFYLFDVGVYRMLRKGGPADASTELDGAALEGLVLQHLRAWCDYSSGKFEIFYWRTKAGLEVDFIVYGEKCFWAIEVKNSSKVHSKDVRGLKHFQEDYPEAQAILLYRGERLIEEGVLCLPIEEFLKNLRPNAALWGMSESNHFYSKNSL